MANVEYYTKNRKVYHYEPTPSELEEIKDKRRRCLYGRLRAEREAAEKEALYHSQGYCPKCFLLKPLTGICPTCD